MSIFQVKWVSVSVSSSIFTFFFEVMLQDFLTYVQRSKMKQAVPTIDTRRKTDAREEPWTSGAVARKNKSGPLILYLI